MTKRRLALAAATVSVMAAVGVGAVASPAAAAPDCRRLHIASARAALMMDEYLGVDYQGWTIWYDAWLQIEEIIEGYGC
jgi:hypothetical protein